MILCWWVLYGFISVMGVNPYFFGYVGGDYGEVL